MAFENSETNLVKSGHNDIILSWVGKIANVGQREVFTDRKHNLQEREQQQLVDAHLDCKHR